MKKEILAVKQTVSKEHALDTVAKLSEDFTPSLDKQVFYPYYWFRFNGTVKFLCWKRNFMASCLVDGITEQTATTDKFEPRPESVDIGNILESTIDQQQALREAERYVIHAAIHGMKSLLFPRVNLQEEALLYIPFWIIRCHHPQKPAFGVSVHGLTGSIQILENPLVTPAP